MTLLEVVREWLRRAPDQRADPAVFAEILSDIIRLDFERGCVVTQVKRTLRKPSFEAALAEFEKLEEMVTKAGLDVGPIRYRIVCSIGNLDRARRWLAAWSKEADPDTRLLCERLELVREPRPRETTLALLANDLHAPAPATTFHRALEPLFKAARNGNFREAAAEMWGVLIEAERAVPAPHSIYVWTSSDRQPRTILRGDVISGTQPLVDHLRNGCFAPRVDIDELLVPEVLQWLEEKAENPSSKLQVLWLAAPPGAGKSVAMLQVLARVHAGNRHQVLFAGNVHSNLAASIDWSLSLTGDDSPPVIGIDDAYLAEHRRRLDSTWDEVVAHLAPSRHAGSFEDLPLIVAAGTSDQANQLAEDFADHLEVCQLSLPAESEVSIGSLAAWFEQRTGGPIQRRIDPSQPLVHSVFEWTSGSDLRDFAIRQRRHFSRLDEGEAALALAEQVLLLNVFGLGLPACCLTEQLAPALADRLRPFFLGNPELSAGVELRIAHRLVAEEMAEFWFANHPRDAIAERFAEAAAGVAEHAVTAGERAGPARLLATLAWRGPDDLLGDVREVAAKLYPVVIAAAGGSIPREQLLAWLSLRASGARLDDPDPIDVAALRLLPQELVRPGTASLVLALLRTAKRMTVEQRNDVPKLVMGLLERDPHWRGWWDVAIALAETLPDPGLPDVVAKRAVIQRSAVSGRALLAIEKALPRRQEVGAAAATIAQDREHPAWPYAWSVLWGRHAGDSLAARAILWMKDVGTHRSMAWVWSTLWDQRKTLIQDLRDDCVACGLEFLELELSPVGWARLWSTLWDDEPTLRRRLRPLGEDWLAIAGGTEQGVPHVWKRLWRNVGRDDARREALRREGARWLALALQQKGWGHVFAALAREGELEGIEELGYSWLRTASYQHHDWVRVWQALRGTPWGEENCELLAEEARRWLKRAPVWHRGRSRLVEDLRHDAVGPWLFEETTGWLESHADLPETWGWVWAALDDGCDSDLRRLGTRFCRKRMQDPAWARVWSILLKAEADPGLIGLGRCWLEANPLLDISRYFVTQALLEVDIEGMPPDVVADLKVVREKTLSWMRMVEKWGDDGDQVWQYLFDTEPELRTQLLPAARRWLRTVEPEARGWIDVWRRVWSEFPDDPECLGLLSRQFDRFEKRPFLLRGVVYSLLGLPKHDPATRPLLEVAIGMATTGPEQVAATPLRAFLAQLHLAPGDGRERHDRLLTETVAALVAAVDPSSLDDLFDPIVAWVAEQPGRPGIVLAEAIKALEKAGLAGIGDRYLAAASSRLEEHSDEDDLRWVEVRGAIHLRDPERADGILRAAVARINESDSLSIELATTTLRACARVGSLDTLSDLLRWAVGYLDKNEPQRTDETLVSACNASYIRLRAAGSLPDAELLRDFGRIYNDWRAAFPKAPVPPLGYEGRRFREGDASIGADGGSGVGEAERDSVPVMEGW